MPKQRTLPLTQEERADLLELRDHAQKPYVRERAAALLQVSEGKSGRWVALNGLLRPRQPETVYDWLNRYEAEGIDGLYIEDGRGRKPAYEP